MDRHRYSLWYASLQASYLYNQPHCHVAPLVTLPYVDCFQFSQVVQYDPKCADKLIVPAATAKAIAIVANTIVAR